jgi:cytochrome c553
MVGDIEISPQDFSASLDPEQRIAKCLSCHGHQAGGDIDFGPDVRFGTPALRGMRENYLRESLVAYQAGTRRHKEMSPISAMLDEETMNFMARSFAAYPASPMKSADELTALAGNDALFRQGQTIARQGFSQHGVPACMSCHGPLGEGSAVGPRLAGQNAMYIESQLKAFASGSRQTDHSAPMQPVAAGLADDDIKAVAHYYESVSVISVVANSGHTVSRTGLILNNAFSVSFDSEFNPQDSDNFTWFDYRLDIPLADRLTHSIGKQKEPISLPRLMTLTWNPMQERAAVVNAMLASRNIGVSFSGNTFNENAKQYTGRVTWLLMLSGDERNLIHVAVAVRHHDAKNGLRYKAVPEVKDAPLFVDTGLFAADSAPAAVWNPSMLR